LNVRDTLTNRDDRSSAAVAWDLGLIKAAADRLHCGQNPIAPDLADDVPHQIWPCLRFLRQALPRKLERCALGASGNNRSSDLY
jgi:hypothetical protein